MVRDKNTKSLIFFDFLKSFDYTYKNIFYWIYNDMKKLIVYLFVGLFWTLGLNLIWWNIAYANAEVPEEAVCSWIKLNTNFPILWNCIEYKSNWENPTNAFPKMVWALTKIIMSLILVGCFIWVIIAWIMRAADNPWTRKSWWAKWLLARIAIVVLLLWFSWAILRLINPNFFS